VERVGPQIVGLDDQQKKSITSHRRIDTVAPMSATVVTLVAHRRRLERAHAWLESRGQSEELLVVGATLDGANELARAVAELLDDWFRDSIAERWRDGIALVPQSWLRD
jgi:hypothetical protein